MTGNLLGNAKVSSLTQNLMRRMINTSEEVENSVRIDIVTWVYIFLKNPYLSKSLLCIVFKILKLPQNFSPKLGYF